MHGSARRRSNIPPSERRRASERRGRTAELAAAVALTLKGYRILARRYSSPLGEIDLIAVRGTRLAFVEVKQRASLEAAEASIGEHQAYRVRAAADLWLARRPRYQDRDVHFDAVLVLPWRWPRHVEDRL